MIWEATSTAYSTRKTALAILSTVERSTDHSTDLNYGICGKPTRQRMVIKTHYSPMGAKRIDPIYTTKELSTKKVGVETVAAAFTNHLAVILRLYVEVPSYDREMNTSLFDE